MKTYKSMKKYMALTPNNIKCEMKGKLNNKKREMINTKNQHLRVF